VASGWLTKQLRDTREQLRAAQKGLEKHCS
jgi:hypothetical protein